MRPFTLGRLADIIRLTRVFQGITSEHVEEAMMVTRDRAVELLKQAEEMRLIKLDGALYCSTNLGNAFAEALKNDDRIRLDRVLSEYAPYSAIKNIVSKRSTDIMELKKITGLTEVAIEVVLRLLQYARDDLCSMGEKFFLRTNELPKLDDFLSSVKRVYAELNNSILWGRPKEFIRVDKIAGNVCGELRLSIDDFSKLLDEVLESNSIVEVHSEVVGYQFMPFSRRKLNPASYRRCYMRLRV